MKRGLIISIVVGIILLIVVGYYIINDEEDVSPKIGKMEVKGVFEQGEKIPVKYTADGDDVSPPLEITGVPAEAESLVLIMDDPDAPSGDWVHWVVFNITVRMNKIDEGDSPGVVGVNSWGRNDYGGPSPPSGIHRYFFKVYVLDVELNLDEGAEKDDVVRVMEGHVLDNGELMGVYSRA